MNDKEPSAMSTNERLLIHGLLEAWDKSLSENDREKAAQVLMKAGLESDAADKIVMQVFSNPDMYQTR